jgi:SAM-dependent methyltransferase
MDLKEQEALGGRADQHWYYQAKSAAMLRFLQGSRTDSVLDIGAGSGFFSRYLLAHTECAEALCVDPNYPAEWSETDSGKPIRFVHEATGFHGHLALMMDVLEHVPDDAGLLKEYAEKLPAGARILITVPAMPWMWSGHDVFLEHYRRYTVSGVDRLIAACGLKRVKSCYFFGLALPLAAGVRLGRRLLAGPAQTPMSDMRPHGTFTNAALLQICRAELAVFQSNRLAGLSVFALAELPA